MIYPDLIGQSAFSTPPIGETEKHLSNSIILCIYYTNSIILYIYIIV